MTDEQADLFENECLRQWLETTRTYLFAELDSLPGASVKANERDTASRADKQDTHSTVLARKRDQRRRMVRRSQSQSKGKRISATPQFASGFKRYECFFEVKVCRIARRTL